MNNDATLRDYYIKIQNLYNNAVTMLTAINKSLTTSSSSIEVSLSEDGNVIEKMNIPSFLYLDSKLEELTTSVDSLFNIPENGEAWFTKDNESFKLNLIRSNTAPISPNIFVDVNNPLTSGVSDSNILKDMVMPKTYLRLELERVPNIVTNMFMRKVIIYNQEIYSAIAGVSKDKLTYSALSALLYNLKRGADYDEYDSVLDLPIRSNLYESEFRINNILTDRYVVDGKSNYKIQVDKVTYKNAEDSSITYTLTPNTKICLGNSTTVFNIKSVVNNTIEIESYIGDAHLQTTVENQNMVLQVYEDNNTEKTKINIPLEENQYVVIFLGSIWNNTRSILSTGLAIDLGTIKMVDNFGNPILDEHGNQYNYLSYYNTYCTNLGDILYGMSKEAYSQITNYTNSELEEMLYSDNAKYQVNQTISNDILKVVAINKHLTDDTNNANIVNLHNQKNEINARLQTCQSNIDKVYSTMLTTDFSQNVTVTQAALQEKIQSYYTERIELQKQLNAVIDNINAKVDNGITSESKTKYRVRGISNTYYLDSFVNSFHNLSIIGIEVEYKYKSTSKDTATLTTINGNTFTDWNKQISYDKERQLVFNENGYYITFVDYNDLANSIKWNQIDIPINYGEDVVIRVRYKYSVGQPYINLYTPWSDELTVVFPQEFTENVEISSIIQTNNKDSITASFNKTLIDEGYTEHIQNKVLSNQQTFFHLPENIYSGYNTPDNNLISLKDKLTEMVNDIEKYKQYIDNLTNSAFEVYLAYDNNSVLLSPNTINKINIYNTEHLVDVFIRKEMNIVIKNTGSTRLNLYSIFPGNIDTHLINTDNSNFQNKGVYERVPMFIGNKLDGQFLGQYIYFRSTNPYTGENIYFDDTKQNFLDYKAAISGKGASTEFNYNFLEYINKDNRQCLLAFRNNNFISQDKYSLIKQNDEYGTWLDRIGVVENNTINETIKSNYVNFDFFKYSNYNDITVLNGKSDKTIRNQYILRYEDILVNKDANGNIFQLSNTTQLSSLIGVEYPSITYSEETANEETIKVTDLESLFGAFLYPNILSKSQIVSEEKDNIKYIEVGDSLTIPIVFEYFTTANKPSITKSLFFDIKHSTVADVKHFLIEVTGNYDFTTSSEVYKDVDFDIVS